jgi:hypothetical protein
MRGDVTSLHSRPSAEEGGRRAEIDRPRQRLNTAVQRTFGKALLCYRRSSIIMPFLSYFNCPPAYPYLGLSHGEVAPVDGRLGRVRDPDSGSECGSTRLGHPLFPLCFCVRARSSRLACASARERPKKGAASN